MKARTEYEVVSVLVPTIAETTKARQRDSEAKEKDVLLMMG